MSTTHVTVNDMTMNGGIGLGGPFQVVLHNDNHNTGDHVMQCLMSIFGHSRDLAMKLMMEAHNSGKTIAQVEDYDSAMQHANQLMQAGLIAEAEPI
jgi:ATP-dependent Clp protease adapter protein ClpS